MTTPDLELARQIAKRCGLGDPLNVESLAVEIALAVTTARAAGREEAAKWHDYQASIADEQRDDRLPCTSHADTVAMTHRESASAIRSLTSQPSPSEWRTMESAPKDGTPVLGLCDWEPCTVVLYWKDGNWLVHWDDENFADGFEATHWQPLPRPPSPDHEPPQNERSARDEQE